MARLIPCSGCRQHIAPSEGQCPFCERPLRTTTAWPAWLLGLSLTSMGACVGGPDDPTETRASSNSGSNTQGNDSIDDDTESWGEGATYAGPDPSSSSATDTEYGTTIETTETDSWGEGATYAGPDDNSGTFGTDTGTDTGSGTGSGSGSDTGGAETDAFNDGGTTAGVEPTDAP